MFSLDQFVITNLFAVLMVFTRVGSGLMMMPGFAESYVLMRARLLLAVMISIVMMPVIAPLLPPIPKDAFSLFLLIASEAMIGIVIATVARFLMSAMHTTGQIISMQSGLSIASEFDFTQATQSTVVGNLLSTSALLLLFALDLHHVMLRGLSDSYMVFAPGQFPPIHETASYFAVLLGHVFTIGFKLSAPVVVVGLLMYLGTGLLSRLMPAIQFFSIIQPAQIAIGLLIVLIAFSTIMNGFVEHFNSLFSSFLEEPF